MDSDNLHVHQFRETIVPSTCQTKGYTLYTCDCGYTHKTNFTPVAAHSYRITEVTPATCSQSGQTSSVCSSCGESIVQTLPPLGHDYSEWIISSYPTCQESGMRVRKCHRCTVVKEERIPPTEHRCAPNTARYDRGKLIEFFCANCGQTIRCAPIKPPASNAPGNFWATKLMLLLTAVFATLQLVFMVLFDLDPSTSFVNPWLAYSAPFLTISFYMLYFFNAKKIKQAENYTRWIGIAPLTFAVYIGFNAISTTLLQLGILGTDELASLLLSNISPFLNAVFFVILAFLLFSGTKKKLWLFIALLAHTVTFESISIISLISLSSHWFNDWHAPYQYSSFFFGLFRNMSLAMLIVPVRKTSPEA